MLALEVRDHCSSTMEKVGPELKDNLPKGGVAPALQNTLLPFNTCEHDPFWKSGKCNKSSQVYIISYLEWMLNPMTNWRFPSQCWE